MTPNRSWNPPRERTHHTCLFDSWSLMKSRGDERSFFSTFVSNFKMRYRDQVSRKPKVEDGSRARLERRPYAVFESRTSTHTRILKNPYPRKEGRTWKNVSKEEGGGQLGIGIPDTASPPFACSGPNTLFRFPEPLLECRSTVSRGSTIRSELFKDHSLEARITGPVIYYARRK